MKAITRSRTKRTNPDELRPEYDFRGGIRGKHADRFAQGSNVVVLEPDVAADYPTAAAVNDALRALADIARRQKRVSRNRKVVE